MTARTALVTGASGAIGSHLPSRLVDLGWRVRVLTRDADRLAGSPWVDDVEVVVGDATSPVDMARATDGVDVAWFLIHSMSGSLDYAERDREIAAVFAQACATADVSRIVYLGGLLPDDELSEHLDSRRDVGTVLLDGSVPTAVLQAGIVLGPGSVSYELLRRSAELPVLVVPRWVDHRVQPIGLDDVLHYLVGAADLPAEVSRTFDVGGPDVLTYAELMAAAAQARGRRAPRLLRVPVLLPATAAAVAGVVAPAPTTLVAALVESLQHDMVCRERDITEHVGPPSGGPTSVADALVAALAAARSSR